MICEYTKLTIASDRVEEFAPRSTDCSSRRERNAPVECRVLVLFALKTWKATSSFVWLFVLPRLKRFALIDPLSHPSLNSPFVHKKGVT